jgi:hypothetical protein
MFESLKIKDARSIVFMKRVFSLFLGAYLVIGFIAAYRAWFQVKSLELQSTSATLKAGTAVETKLVSYARTTVEVKLELVQGTRAESFAVQSVPGNTWAFFDPRTRQGSQLAVLTPDILERFAAGRAQLRATATGRKQWGRLPPPVVRELVVEIEPQ